MEYIQLEYTNLLKVAPSKVTKSYCYIDSRGNCKTQYAP